MAKAIKVDTKSFAFVLMASRELLLSISAAGSALGRRLGIDQRFDLDFKPLSLPSRPDKVVANAPKILSDKLFSCVSLNPKWYRRFLVPFRLPQSPIKVFVRFFPFYIGISVSFQWTLTSSTFFPSSSPHMKSQKSLLCMSGWWAYTKAPRALYKRAYRCVFINTEWKKETAQMEKL